MRAQHTTLRRNLGGILRHGLLCKKAKGKMKVVWLHEKDKTAWAFLHVIKRHGGKIEDVVSIEVDVPDSWLRRSSVPGLFFVPVDVDASLLGFITEFAMVAASPLEDA